MIAQVLPEWPNPPRQKKIVPPEVPNQGNLAASWQWRQTGLCPRGSLGNDTIFREAAEDNLVFKEKLQEMSFDVPGVPRSTFLMVFSPDGTKVASTHGNHNVYVSELSSGRHVQTLVGHPRTPWCVAFHPARTQLLASGCLGGQVRVWDLNGGSETWTTTDNTVIASLAFHPRDCLLVIATYNMLYFWDWSQPQPFMKLETKTNREKVRFVSFDTLGHKLITGISVWAEGAPTWGGAASLSGGGLSPPHAPPPAPGDQLSTYHQLLQRYDSLVRNYHNLYLARTHLTNTTDRGTDPMEVEQNPQHAAPTSAAAAAVGSSEARPASSQANTSTESNDMAGPSAPSIPPAPVPPPVPPPVPRSFQNLIARHISAFQPTPQMIINNIVNNMSPPLPVHASSLLPPGPAPPPPNFVMFDGSVAAPRELEAAESLANLMPPRPPLPAMPAPPRPPSPPPLPRWLRRPLWYPPSPNHFRREMIISLNHLQSFMENSIEETLSFWEDYDTQLLRSRNAQSPVGTPRSGETENRNAPSTSTSEPTTSAHSSNSAPSTPTASLDEAFAVGASWRRSLESESDSPTLEYIRNILRVSGDRLFSLIMGDESAAGPGLVGQLHSRRERFSRTSDYIQHTVRLLAAMSARMRQAASDNTEGSDSDREMFSPLPMHIYRTRNANAPDAAENNESPRRLFPEFDPLATPDNLDDNYDDDDTWIGRITSRPRDLLQMARIMRVYEFANNGERRTPSTTQPTTSNTNNNNTTPPTTNNNNTSETPSTSAQTAQETSASNEAFARVTRGVQTIERHTEALRALWENQTTQPPLWRLRRMWEDLRRELNALHRPVLSRQASVYIRNPVLRSGFVNIGRSRLATGNRNPSRPPRQSETGQPPTRRESAERSPRLDVPSTSTGITHAIDAARTAARIRFRDGAARSTPRDPNQAIRRRVRSLMLGRVYNSGNHQLWLGSGSQRRLVGPVAARGSFRSFMRRQEVELTRNCMRFHARRILAIMFNIIVSCLEETQLGDQIISMLRALKKALGLTCLLIMSQHSHRTAQSNEGPATPEHNFLEVNVSNSSDSGLPPSNQSDPLLLSPVESASATDSNPLSQPVPHTAPLSSASALVPPPKSPGCWRARLAVQISAANRNNSNNAKRRKEMYHQLQRARAKRGVNPTLRSKTVKTESRSSASASSKTQTTQLVKDNAVPSTSGTQNRLHEIVIIPTENPYDVSASASSASSLLSGSGSPVRSPMLRQIFVPRRTAVGRATFRRSALTSEFVREVLGALRSSEVRRHQVRQPADAEPPRSHQPIILSVRGPSYSNAMLDAIRRRSYLNREMSGMFGNVVVPMVQVNDIPVPAPDDVEPPRGREPADYFPAYYVPEERLLDVGPPHLGMDSPSPIHRIQVWDFTNYPQQLPDISNATQNVVVQKCKIHNDASIDISSDGRLLVALMLPQRYHTTRTLTHQLGIYSLDWSCLGDCLYTTALEQNAVSVSLSPCARYLAVGLGVKRVALHSPARGAMAVIYRLGHSDKTDGGLWAVRRLEQSWDMGVTSLNCLRWAPQPGQGLLLAINTGQLKMLS